MVVGAGQVLGWGENGVMVWRVAGMRAWQG